MHLSDLTPDYALGLLENHTIHLCLYIATIIQSMLESDDVRFQAILFYKIIS